MPKKSSPPPLLQCDRLKFAAKIDYVTVPVGRKPGVPPLFDGTAKLIKPKFRDGMWMLTLHDPTRMDIVRMVETYDNPMVMELEVAVDLSPKDSLTTEDRSALLEETFKAVVGRLRPEDATLWSYGSRGGVNAVGSPVMPLERRQAHPGEQVIYGNRGSFMQAKLYLKTTDQGADLPPSEHVVRMEVRLRRGACMDERLALDRLQDLLGYEYRATFTKHFRIILEPALRNPGRLSAEESRKREKKMLTAWATAGVAKFPADDDQREDTTILDLNMIQRRRRTQLPLGHYKLMRDQVANAKIGSALMNLQRRMRG